MPANIVLALTPTADPKMVGRGGIGLSLPNSKGLATAPGGVSFNPTWFSYTSSNSGTLDDYLLDGAPGSRKWSGFLGGPGGGQPTMLALSNGALVTTFDATTHYQMVEANAKWAAPTVGQHLFLSMLQGVSCPGDMHSCHNWQLNNGSGSYLLFMHPLGNGGTDYRWDFELATNAGAPRYYVRLLQIPTYYFINLRLSPQSSTVAKIAARVYNLDGTIAFNTSDFLLQDGAGNLESNNPDVTIPSGDQSHYNGQMELGNNSDAGIAASNVIINKYCVAHITTDANDWPGARIPS